jgi:AraC-like DNA-binding protein
LISRRYGLVATHPPRARDTSRRKLAEIAHGALLADAAYAVGFADQSHMTRHFKARFGLTPGRYAALSGNGDHAYQAKLTGTHT